MYRGNDSKLRLLLILAVALLMGSSVQAGTEGGFPNVVSFSLDNLSGIGAWISGTRDNPEQEVITLTLMVTADDAGTATLAEAGLTLEYDPALLTFLEARPAAGWGSIDVETDTTTEVNPSVGGETAKFSIFKGSSSIVLTNTATAVAEFDFAYPCQSTYNLNPVSIVANTSTQVETAADTYWVTESARALGISITPQNYGYMSRLADQTGVLVLEGVLGTEILVPILIETSFKLGGFGADIFYNNTELELLGIESWDNYFSSGAVVPGTIPNTLRIDLETDEAEHPRAQFAAYTKMADLRFRVLGSWQGEASGLYFAANPDVLIARDDGYCNEAGISLEHTGNGSVAIPRYEARFTTEILDGTMANYGNTARVKISLTNNFPAAPNQNDLIANFDLGPKLDFDGIYETFIDMMASPFYGGGGGNVELSLRRFILPGVLDISATPQPLMTFDLEPAEPPTSFNSRFLEFTYQTTWDSEEIYDAKVVDATGSVTVTPGDGTLTWDTPGPIEYIMGEFYSNSARATASSSVTQTYYIRHAFELTDFRLKITVSGAHHMYECIPQPGFKLLEFDNVNYLWAVLGPDPDTWESRPYEDEHDPIATIKYNKYGGTIMSAKGIPSGGYWRWTYSDITFSDVSNPDASYMAIANGHKHHVALVPNNIGTAVWIDDGVVNPPPRDDFARLGSTIPDEYALNQNYPNPFNPTTEIQYGLPEAGHATLTIYNITGQTVATPVNGWAEAGYHTINWDASMLPSGVYLYRLTVGNFAQTRKMMLIK